MNTTIQQSNRAPLRKESREMVRLGFQYLKKDKFLIASRIFQTAAETESSETMRYVLALAYAQAGRMEIAKKVFDALSGSGQDDAPRKFARFGRASSEFDPLALGKTPVDAEEQGGIPRESFRMKVQLILERSGHCISTAVSKSGSFSHQPGTVKTFLAGNNFYRCFTVETREFGYDALRYAGATECEIAELERIYRITWAEQRKRNNKY